MSAPSEGQPPQLGFEGQNGVPSQEGMNMAPPPPSYSEVIGSQAGWTLSYVDFSPQCLSEGGFLSSPIYERFDVLVQRANQWLLQHPEVRVRTCESIENKAKQGDPAVTEKTTFFESGQHYTFYIRSLRLFVVPAAPGDQPQQIGYLNVVPACYEPGGLLSAPKFESFGDTITKFNQMLREKPLPGTICNVETQEMKFKTWGNEVNPDACYWSEHGDRNTYFLTVIRIFYAAGPPAYEEIGCVDFVPDCLKEGGVFSLPVFSPFSTVVQKAGMWLQQQQGIRVTNIQSIDYKLKQGWSGTSLDTQRSLYLERGESRTWYIRIVRVCFVRLFNGQLPPAPPPYLTYRTFVPAQLTSGGVFTTPQFETMSNTMKRAMAWFQYNSGVKILAAETVPIRMFTGNQYGNHEQTFTYEPGDRNERWLLVLRVYMDGQYQEPPPAALPAQPQIQQSDAECCVIL